METSPRTPADLELELRRFQPAVCVMKIRHIRTIVRRAEDDGEVVLRVPGKGCWVNASQVRNFEHLSRPLDDHTSERLLLVPEPDDLFPRRISHVRERWYYERLLTRSSYVLGLQRKFEAGELTANDILDRFKTLGSAAETELRFVLVADHDISEEDDDFTVYRTFVAVYLDLAQNQPTALPWVFPMLALSPNALKLVLADIPLNAIQAINTPRDGLIASRYQPPPTLTHSQFPERFRNAAEKAARKGNYVRAAVLQAHRIPSDGLSKPRAFLKDGLLARMQPVLGWSDSTLKLWIAAFEPLLPYLAEGTWSRPARFLYELQKIPVDLEGEISIVDPIEWASTFGKRPLKRTLTRARTAILLRHLKHAHGHLVRTTLPEADRQRLEELLDHEIHTAEGNLRAELSPVIRGVFDEVGFVPVNRVESIAREKIIAELLDRLTERGFLRFGDFRDLVARNSIKLNDLSPREWWTGDKLLQADRRLALELDGVYRGGEFYLRLIHRGTAVGFGTKLGRFLALYLLFPFLGAFLTVEAGKFLLHELTKVYGFISRQLPQRQPDETAILEGVVPPPEVVAQTVPKSDEHGITLTPESLAIIAGLGLFYLALIHLPIVRTWIGIGFRLNAAALRWVFVTAPLAVWRTPAFVKLRKNRVVRFANQQFGVAFLAAAFVALVLTFFAAGVYQTVKFSGATFAIISLIAITPTGRRVGDELGEMLADAWRNLHANLIPGLIAWIAWAFRAVAGAFERGLYSVDEWFRFRENQSSGSYGFKVVLAVVWFPVAYLSRFVFYLLVEPQVNPVKHFPIVTVSHKVIWPLLPELGRLLGSDWTAAAIINGIPGIFGFIAWELKEDWRLYTANRSTSLPRVVLGHHGETMRGYLRPGFHSGTVPKLYRKLRRTLAKSELSEVPVSAEKLLHGLDEVKHSIEAFVDRELLPLVNGSDAWKGVTLSCHSIRVGVQAIEIELQLNEPTGHPVRVAFERQEDSIRFRMLERGWWDELTAEQSTVLGTALDGFAEMGSANENGPRRTWTEWAEWWGN